MCYVQALGTCGRMQDQLVGPAVTVLLPLGQWGAGGLLGGDALLSGSPRVKARAVRQHFSWEPLT